MLLQHIDFLLLFFFLMSESRLQRKLICSWYFSTDVAPRNIAMATDVIPQYNLMPVYGRFPLSPSKCLTYEFVMVKY